MIYVVFCQKQLTCYERQNSRDLLRRIARTSLKRSLRIVQ